MSWRFPEAKFARLLTFDGQLEHLLSEVREIKEASSGVYTPEILEEVADLYHSCETLLRICQRDGHDVHEVFAKVIEKNRARGYYDAD